MHHLRSSSCLLADHANADSLQTKTFDATEGNWSPIEEKMASNEPILPVSISLNSSSLSGSDLRKIKDLESSSTQPGYGGRTDGLGYLRTSLFLVITTVGAGILALPRAMADSGWMGIIMIILFGVSVAFTVNKLGQSWVILEERWPKFRLPVRQPYMEIAEKAFGPIGRRICFGCVIFTLIGNGVTFIILISDMMNSIVPELSLCQWLLVTIAVLWPASFFSTPKDFWLASAMAVFATAMTVIVILIQLGLDIPLNKYPKYPNPTVTSFSLGFSGILFAFGGVSSFPTLQNDMQDRRNWGKAVLICLICVLTLYLPVAIMGYTVIGDAVDSNVLLDLSEGVMVTLAITLNIVNLLVTYLICLSPVGQAFEEILNIPERISWRRIVLRTCIVLLELFISLAIPDFGAILNLIGGSTVAILSFIFPPMIYIRLVNMEDDGTWDSSAPKRTIPSWERAYLWMIVGVAVLGGITSTVSALMNILDPDSFGPSCFSDFLLSHNKNHTHAE